ncbi:MAG: hypothetical protein ACXWWG_00635 [Nitrospira sp.]
MSKRAFSNGFDGVLVVLPVVALVISVFAAWVTHILWLFTTLTSAAGATAGQIVLGILGVFVPPLGVLHGIFLWFT